MNFPIDNALSPAVAAGLRAAGHDAVQQVSLILTSLARIDAALRRGAIVVLERRRLRLRELPITRQQENGP